MEEGKTQNVVLTEVEREIVEKVQKRRGLGKRGFSAALRIIIREWAEKGQDTSSNGKVNHKKSIQ